MLAYRAGCKDKDIEIDAGIKLILAVCLAVTVSLCNSLPDLLYFALYLLCITFLLKTDRRFILKNLLAYGIVFVFPYLFGLLLSLAFSRLLPGLAYAVPVNVEAVLMKMVKIFFVWYIGSLYFFTTPFELIADMLNKVFFPLNSRGLPVGKYVNMTVFIVKELTNSVNQFKEDILEQARQIIKNDQLQLKSKFREFTNILVDYIADSLQQADELQKRLELDLVDDGRYTLRISKNEVIAVLSLSIFFLLLCLKHIPGAY